MAIKYPHHKGDLSSEDSSKNSSNKLVSNNTILNY